MKRLLRAKARPTLHMLDTKHSREFKDAIEVNKMRCPLVPPQDHRKNVAEKAVGIFKYHFSAVLCLYGLGLSHEAVVPAIGANRGAAKYA